MGVFCPGLHPTRITGAAYDFPYVNKCWHKQDNSISPHRIARYLYFTHTVKAFFHLTLLVRHSN